MIITRFLLVTRMGMKRGIDMDKVIVARSKIVGVAEEIRKKTNIKRTMTLDEMKVNIREKLGNSSCGSLITVLSGYGTPTELLCGLIEIQ